MGRSPLSDRHCMLFCHFWLSPGHCGLQASGQMLVCLRGSRSRQPRRNGDSKFNLLTVGTLEEMKDTRQPLPVLIC
ncbi:hypothetical protein BDW68DRAFT_163220 [Aspergillus falconensis]